MGNNIPTTQRSLFCLVTTATLLPVAIAPPNLEAAAIAAASLSPKAAVLTVWVALEECCSVGGGGSRRRRLLHSQGQVRRA